MAKFLIMAAMLAGSVPAACAFTPLALRARPPVLLLVLFSLISPCVPQGQMTHSLFALFHCRQSGLRGLRPDTFSLLLSAGARLLRSICQGWDAGELVRCAHQQGKLCRTRTVPPYPPQRAKCSYPLACAHMQSCAKINKFHPHRTDAQTHIT